MSKVLKSTVKSGLSLDYRPKEVESEVREFWERMKIPEKLRELREKENVGELGWYEGPPTLNGTPHVGHARGRVIKDLRYRFRSMQGYLVPFWAGWDTQGLPVELEAEKELGVKNKKELLERVGEERFVEECKKIVKKYYSYWESADKKLGVFIDHERAYWTYKDEYIEREWQYLKRAWEQGLLGEGYYIVAYCPSCQTSLSNAEAGLGYKEVEDPSVYFKFKVAGSENEYFVVWTTMPFTIVTDLMLAVHPDHEYAKVKVGDEVWIMADRRVEPLMEELGIEDYVKLGKVLGRELEGVKYEYPFLDLVPKQREFEANLKVHTVVAEDFVDVESASGVVHLAPGNGEEDFLVAQKRGVPIFVPYDDEVKFTSDAGAFSGLFARDADEKVIDELRKRGLLIECGTVRHEYPTCWRSH
ncbi:class I tRNA ligase family protein, partial [Candidatus Bathyarchaeota archaeon]|nr:class I tRNA ligase family protein [Candidatus Bathyarchaeota archaeon]